MKIWSSDIFSATLYHTLSELLLNGSDTADGLIEGIINVFSKLNGAYLLYQ